MKCEHCGKNEATFYYKSNINGQVTEQHLCSDCAKEMGYVSDLEKSFANFSASMFGGFDDLFSPVPALAGSFFEPFEAMNQRFERMFPMLGGTVAVPAAEQAAEQASPAQSASGNDLVSDEEHKRLDRERQINALRCEMRQAIETENFERAAALRDQIHGLEKQG